MPFRRISLRRKKKSHKGDYGSVLVIAGSRGLTGAALLASLGAARGGAGLVTLGTPKAVYPILARRSLEVMTRPLKCTREGTLHEKSLGEIHRLLEKADALALGPGLSTHPSTRRLVKSIVKRIEVPMVLDADGINALRGDPGILKRCGAPLILTPHDGEFCRLFGFLPPQDLSKRRSIAKKISANYDCILVLKGSPTLVAEPSGRCFVNRSGNPGMATGGTGDILTGLVAAFCAQGLSPFLSASAAVWIHGKAGDLAARETGFAALLARDLLAKLPEVLKRVEKVIDLPRFLGL